MYLQKNVESKIRINFRYHSAGWSWIYSSLSLFLYSYYLHFLVVSTYDRRIQFIKYKVKVFQPEDLSYTKFYLTILILGANQLLWYYADLEKKRCYNQDHPNEAVSPASHMLQGNISIANVTGFAEIEKDINHCLAWRRFAK